MRKRIWSNWLGIKGHIEDTRKGKMIEISRQNSYLEKKPMCSKRKWWKQRTKPSYISYAERTLQYK